MPIRILTYGQELDIDVNASIPQLNDVQNVNVNKMRKYFSQTPPAAIVFAGEYLTPEGKEVKEDGRVELLCSLVHVNFHATNRWGSPHLYDEPFHIHGFRYELSRLHNRLAPGELGLVICSKKAASLACRMPIESLELIEINSIPGDVRIPPAETVRMPPPQIGFDEETRAVSPEEQEEARKGVLAVMAAQQSAQTGRRIADFAPDGIDLRQVLPELEDLVAQGRQKKEEEKTNPAWYVLWTLFALCMCGVAYILIRTAMN